MKRVISLTLLMMIASTVAYSDLAPARTPKPTPEPSSKAVKTFMSIKMDPKTQVATLSIPREQLKQLRAELDQLDPENGNTAAATGVLSQVHTIVSGAFLSLAIVFGGMWFVRSGRSATKSSRPFVILAMIGIIGSAASYVYANAGPPPELRSISSTLFDKKTFGYWTSAGGGINLTVSEASVVELKVPAPKNWPRDKENNQDDE